MNKNKIVMSAIGGVALVALLAIGYSAFSTWSERTMMEEDLDVVRQNVQRLRSAKVAPVEASVKAIDDNREKLSAWRNEALALASRGDERPEAGVTAAAFKQKMVDDARELARLPGAANNGVLTAEGFGFGFKDIITGGSMPEAAKLERLQRQWSDIKLFVRTLAACGAAELTGVTIVDAPAESDLGRANDSAAKQNKKNRRNKQAASSSSRGEAEASHLPTLQSYELSFRAKPAAFVRVLNALGSAERFVTVDDFAFARAEDALATMLGGGKEKTATTSRRGGRRRRAAAETVDAAEPEETVKKGLVTDPESAAPLAVTLKLSTFDFGSESDSPSQPLAGRADSPSQPLAGRADTPSQPLAGRADSPSRPQDKEDEE